MPSSWPTSPAREGCAAEREVPIPVKWDNIEMEVGFRADLIVEGMVLWN